ncbi:unnamed protein product [Protopolystoma xenopodis]|uniref:Uncharacterized protein n=1 Tax=Protopolystoma xenopodis TaxID=117903 RepID=A0A3S5BME9_9PLAT|nr:unnamed protein product [Protopolystoma xenopodis]
MNSGTRSGASTNCNQLWRAWYPLLASGLHIFLVYVGISRYLTFRAQAFDAKFGGDWDQSVLNLYLGLLVAAMTSFCLFAYTSLVTTPNYSNEGVQLGRDTDNLRLLASLQTLEVDSGPNGQTSQSPSRLLLPGQPMVGGNSLYASANGVALRPGFGLGLGLGMGLLPGDEHLLGLSGSQAPLGLHPVMLASGFDSWSGRSASALGVSATGVASGAAGLGEPVGPVGLAFAGFSQRGLHPLSGQPTPFCPPDCDCPTSGPSLAPNGHGHRRERDRERDTDRGSAPAVEEDGLVVGCRAGLLRLVRHFMPISALLHLISAYCLALPIPVMQAQQIFYRALSEGRPVGLSLTRVTKTD